MSSPTRRILIVDDNEGAVKLLSRLLNRLGGHEVAQALNGAAALAQFKQFQPEVVLLDIGLPGMNGHEVAQRIRAMPGGGQALLVALTGYGEEEDRQKSFAAGFDEHLVKPASADTLTALFSHSKLLSRP